jgi:predicted  nucleic acid-binding Zn-ribbon protein
MNSIEDLLAEIIRLKKLLSEKDEALEKMNYEISALVKFIVSKNKFSNSIVNVDVVPNFTKDGQDVVKRSKF